MHPIKDDVVKASKQIGLTNSQADKLWEALKEIQTNKSKPGFLAALIYIGAMIALLSMTWFYTAHLNNGYSLLISVVYALLFFSTGFYFWHTKKLKIPAGVLCLLGIVIVPLVVYSLQNTMNWFPEKPLNGYSGFYQWIHGYWIPMEICTLAVACIVVYFIRIPFLTIPIYFALSFITMDAIHLFTDPKTDHWLYYCIAAIMMGTILNVLGFTLGRRDQKNFAFWSYLFGMLLCWSGITGLDIKTEWGYFVYFLINIAFILVARFFHRKIFMFFGTLGIIVYLSHLTYVYSNSVMFSYILAAIGFSIILLATLLMRSRKK